MLAVRFVAGGLLSLLHLAHLLGVLLLHVLSLLLMPLFHLLGSRFRSILSCQLMMFPILGGLQFLAFLVLLNDQPILLLLVFTVQPGVSGVRGGRMGDRC